MSTKAKMSWIAGGCLLVGVCAGAAGAQVLEQILAVRYLNSGLFPLNADESAQFRVSLDDLRAGSSARVRLQFLDERGAVVARDDVVLQAGQSAALEASGPGAFRAHAEVLESTLLFTSRRAVVGSLERFNLTTKQRDPLCSIDEVGSGSGRQ